MLRAQEAFGLAVTDARFQGCVTFGIFDGDIEFGQPVKDSPNWTCPDY
jgi:hypothetical protein